MVYEEQSTLCCDGRGEEGEEMELMVEALAPAIVLSLILQADKHD